MTATLDRHSRILDVLALPTGPELLLRHGYRLGDGFVDVLSQYQTLEDAHREGRIRQLEVLLAGLNNTNQKEPQRGKNRG